MQELSRLTYSGRHHYNEIKFCCVGLTKRLARRIAMVTIKIPNMTKLSVGNGSNLLPDVSIKVSLYPISPIIITVVVINEVQTFGKVS